MLNEDMPTSNKNDAATCEGKVIVGETPAILNRMKTGQLQAMMG